jgi:RNA polymerase sigma factor (sigma-70 family)
MAAQHRPARIAATTADRRDARALYDAVYKFAWNALERLGFSEVDRDDLAQRVVIQAHAGWQSYRASEDTTPGKWLWGIVRNQARMFWRRHPLDLTLRGSIPDVPERTPSIEERVELMDQLTSAWESLPEAERVVVRLHALGYTYEEIADLVGNISKSQVGRLHDSGMQRWRAAIERNREPGSRAVTPFPLMLAALFDPSRTPAPSAEVVENAWRRAVGELGLDLTPDSRPPPSSSRPSPIGNHEAPAGSLTQPGQSAALHLLRFALAPVVAVALALLVLPRAPGCYQERASPERGATTTTPPEPTEAMVAEAATEPTEPAATVAEAATEPTEPAAMVATAPKSTEPPAADWPRKPAPRPRERGSLTGKEARSDREQALALIQRGREALEAGNLVAAIAAFAEHAQRFPDDPHATQREQLWTAACGRARGTPTANVLAQCVGRL